MRLKKEIKKMHNMEIWERVKMPPKEACRIIEAGRMKGKTDINPQWRIQALTENFGICGIGWYYDIVRLWAEQGTDNQVMAFAEIKLYIKVNNEWSKGISGIGGNMQITKEKNGLHNSDECYKMALTDAISVACKMLGFGATIYSGMTDFETKYKGGEPSQNDLSRHNCIIQLRQEATKYRAYLDDKIISMLKDTAKDIDMMTDDDITALKVNIDTAKKTIEAEKKLDKSMGEE
jgi:hypothetical protein